MYRHLLLATALLVPTLSSGAEPAPKPQYGSWGVTAGDMDTSVKPGDGFFDYVEGTWLKKTPIAADKTGVGYNYTLPDEIRTQLRAIVEDAAQHSATATARQIGDFYAA